MDNIIFNGANSRDTYFSIHKIHNAHKYTTGKNIKVGIIDWLFAYDDNLDLYAGCVDISNQGNTLHTQDGHGLWMANTLKEIAPDCQIYAINAITYDSEEERAQLLEKAIDWAVDNNIQILTYSQAMFCNEQRIRTNNAIKYAYENGIITTFIHNDSKWNLWPYGCLEFFSENKFSRLPDLNIFHYDYSIFNTEQYDKYIQKISNSEDIKSGDEIPFFSFSSMSPVLAGFVAMLKEIDLSLSYEEIKVILVRTSYAITKREKNWYDINPCKNVVDIEKAVTMVNNNT